MCEKLLEACIDLEGSVSGVAGAWACWCAAVQRAQCERRITGSVTASILIISGWRGSPTKRSLLSP